MQNLIQQKIMFDMSEKAFGVRGQELRDIVKEVRGIKGKYDKKDETIAIVSAYKRSYKLPDDIDVYGLSDSDLAEIEGKCIRNIEVNYPKKVRENSEPATS